MLVEGSVGVHHAIKGVVVAFGAGSVDRNRVAFAGAHLALLANGLHRACADEEQVEEVASVKRKLLDLLVADELRDRR